MSTPATRCPWQDVGLPAPMADVLPYATDGRRATGFTMERVFPTRTDRLCACGCGAPLPKRARRWASPACSDAAWTTCLVLSGDTGGLAIVCRVKGRARTAPFIGPLPLRWDHYGNQRCPYSRRDLVTFVAIDPANPFGPRRERSRAEACAAVTALPDIRGEEPLTRCAGCRVYRPGGEWQSDHIEPVALGGAHHPGNLQPLCLACHTAKTTTDVRRIRAAQRAGTIPERPTAPVPEISPAERAKWDAQLDTVFRDLCAAPLP